MDNKKYSVTLSDGTVIDNLTLNGNNYISSVEIDPAIFDYNCSPVVISDGVNNETHSVMELVQVTKQGSDFWFVLRDISETELAQMKMQSDIEYIAMMAGVEL